MFKLNKNADANFTSFHDVTLKSSPSKLIEVFGAPHFQDIDGKVNMEWKFESEDGEVFTLYDWKEGKLDALTPIEFHIGSRSEGYKEEMLFKDWLEKELDKEELTL
jgi:hypothetical protein